MGQQIEKRAVTPREVRVSDDGHRVEAVVLVYNVVDDYRTVFRPGCFAESLEKRMPRMCWGHDWLDPIGRWTDYKDTDTELTLVGALDDFDAVPRARQASSQMKSGTIDQFSVGFMRLADEVVDEDEFDERGITAIVKGGLDETSPVLVAAVPGTHLVDIRSARRAALVQVDAAIEMQRRVTEGEISQEEAEAAMRLMAEKTDDDLGTPPPPPEPVDHDALDALADQVLADRGR